MTDPKPAPGEAWLQFHPGGVLHYTQGNQTLCGRFRGGLAVPITSKRKCRECNSKNRMTDKTDPTPLAKALATSLWNGGVPVPVVEPKPDPTPGTITNPTDPDYGDCIETPIERVRRKLAEDPSAAKRVLDHIEQTCDECGGDKEESDEVS